MNFISQNLRYICVMCVAIVIGVAATNAFGQDVYKVKNKDYQSKERSFCDSNNWSNGDRASFRDLREMTMPATGSLTVDSGQNGGITVIGSDRNDIVVNSSCRAVSPEMDTLRGIARAYSLTFGDGRSASQPPRDQPT